MAVTFTKEFWTNLVLFVVACVALGLSIWAFATPCKKDGFGKVEFGSVCCPDGNDCKEYPGCNDPEGNPYKCQGRETCNYTGSSITGCPYTCE